MQITSSSIDTSQIGFYSALIGAVDETQMLQTFGGSHHGKIASEDSEDDSDDGETDDNPALPGRTYPPQTIAIGAEVDGDVDGPMAAEGGSDQVHFPVGTPAIDRASMKRRGPNYNPIYACKLCKHRFSSLSNAKRHIWAHFGMKLHVCQCSKRFTTNQDLKRHIKGLSVVEPAKHTIIIVGVEERVEAKKMIDKYLINLNIEGG